MKFDLPIAEHQQAILNKEITCKATVQHFLDEIQKMKHLNAFLQVFEKDAKEQAEKIDKKVAENQPLGALFGVVFSIKEVICIKGKKVSAGSKMLENFVSPYDATVIKKLKKEDAIIIGSVNCDEFAMGSSGENSAFGPTLNAADTSKIPGGSSSGSAVSVQAKLCHISLGSDTGGSVRMPASYCGVYGFKPSYGSVSRYGLIAYASSFDQIGIFSNHCQDIQKVFQVIKGLDQLDATLEESNNEIEKPKEKYKIAVIKEAIENQGLDANLKSKVETAIENLKKNGHHVELIEFPFLKQMVATYYILTCAEASSNLGRYDGIHYGERASSNDINELITASRTQFLGAEVKKRIMLGTFILTAEQSDKYYYKALKIRRLIKEKTEAIFKNFDFILSPTTTGTAFNLNEKTLDPIQMYLSDIFTVHTNLAGNCAINIPLAKNTTKSLPIGIQLMGKKNYDISFLKTMELLEKQL